MQEFQNLNQFIEIREKKNLSVKGHQSSFVVNVDQINDERGRGTLIYRLKK